MVECFLCDRSFQYGPNLYDGKHLCAWGVIVCDNCYHLNLDEILPETYPKLAAHLAARGVTVRLNVQGRLSWPE